MAARDARDLGSPWRGQSLAWAVIQAHTKNKNKAKTFQLDENLQRVSKKAKGTCMKTVARITPLYILNAFQSFVFLAVGLRQGILWKETKRGNTRLISIEH